MSYYFLNLNYNLENEKMKTYYYDNNKLKFRYYLVPKCGSSTILKVFNFQPTRIRKLTSTSYFSFTFVRNPWSRLVSTRKDKCCSNVNNVYKEMYSPYRNSFKDFTIALINIGVNVNFCPSFS